MTHLWTPWRSAYIEGSAGKRGCVFCEAAQSAADNENFVLYRGAHCFIILNRYPYTSGHLMIAPYEHVPRLSRASEPATGEMMHVTRNAEEILEQIYRPDGLNLGMNLGEAAGAGIEQHIHLHVIPRWKGDGNFMSTVAHTRIIPETLDMTYAKLQPKFAQISTAY